MAETTEKSRTHTHTIPRQSRTNQLQAPRPHAVRRLLQSGSREVTGKLALQQPR